MAQSRADGPARDVLCESTSPPHTAQKTVRILRLGRVPDPSTALGIAVHHLMSKPAYARLGFASWSNVLAGQAARGHYCFVIDESNRVVGMVGWAYTDRPRAERWVDGLSADIGDGRRGNCVVFNLWSSDGPDTTAMVFAATRHAMSGCERLYFRRLYPNGRIRPVRLSVNAFVKNHLSKALPLLGVTESPTVGATHG